MQILLEFVQTLLGITKATYQLLQQIYGTVADVVKEHIPFGIEVMVREAGVTLAHPTWGNHAILNAINALGTGGATGADIVAARSDILNALGTTESNILAALGTPSQAATAPSWWEAPTPPPTPPSAGDVASAVWGYEWGVRPASGYDVSVDMGQMMTDTWSLGSFKAAASGVKNPLSPYFSIVVWEPWVLSDSPLWWGADLSIYTPLTPDWSAVLATDTPYTFLARTQPTFGWSTTGPAGAGDGEVAWKELYGSTLRTTWVRSNFTTLDMLQLAALAPTPEPPTVTVNAAPVWPGIAGVSLGTPVAISDGLVVDGPLDGVLVNITGHPAGAGKYGFGDVDSWRYLGAVLFINDNGQAEWPIQMGPEVGVLTPRSMKRAASAVVRLNGGFTGTVTPWTIVG